MDGPRSLIRLGDEGNRFLPLPIVFRVQEAVEVSGSVCVAVVLLQGGFKILPGQFGLLEPISSGTTEICTRRS